MSSIPSPSYGSGNPHPLSKLKTELVWEGKYDEYGNKRTVDIAGLSMPLQRIETVDEPRQRAAAAGNLEMFEKQLAGQKRDDFRNRLIWGDNKLVMASLLKEFKGCVDLIYIDPPFDVGADFTMDVPIGDDNETVGKDQSTLEMVAYRDMWGKGTDSYLHMMYERLSLMRELLSDKGSIYVHIDYRVASFMRLIMDDVFGRDFFLNQIAWCYKERERVLTTYNPKHDVILFYAKSGSKERVFNWKAATEEFSDVTRKKFKYVDEKGHHYQIRGKNTQGSPLRAADGLTPKDESEHPGLTYRDYLETREGVAPRDWWTIGIINKSADERLGYSTQKPKALIERIIGVSSNQGDLVADFFCGSGTTGAVAEGLGRRWIMSDLGRFAVHTSRKRIIEQQRKLYEAGNPYGAFDVYNLGRYERQWWQKDRLKGANEEHRRVVLEFFRAEVLTSAPSPLIHGRKEGAFCHVDGIDGLFTRKEARSVAEAIAAAGGKECYCLSWEFEMDLRLSVEALKQEYGVTLKLIQIPREIMEKNRTTPPPFFEMALLKAEPVLHKTKEGTSVDIKLTQFLPSLAEVPSKELEALQERAVKSGFDFIDFWAVDFDWKPGKPFSHHWQDYRTRKNRTLKLVSDAGFAYPKKGKYTACVKVVDVFGCDSSITIDVTI
ncbi:MAG: site-specific DNA-methyltransferase [Candidatus Peribacteraceae bacterium]|nr:site-specific DNA-methyltransferase [Candidatus Peribacteraceae bacterium]